MVSDVGSNESEVSVPLLLIIAGGGIVVFARIIDRSSERLLMSFDVSPFFEISFLSSIVCDSDDRGGGGENTLSSGVGIPGGKLICIPPLET